MNLWTEDNPEYKGEFVNFSDISFYPKPFQKPYSPIVVGGNSDYAMKRAAKYANGWQPTWITPDEMKNSTQMGVAGTMGVVLATYGAAWGLVAGLVLYILLEWRAGSDEAASAVEPQSPESGTLASHPD